MSDNLDLLQELTRKPAAVEWFRGLFNCAHLELTDTGEQFAVERRGDGFVVAAGFDGTRPDFVVPVESQNIRNLAGFFADDAVDAYEQYRIVKFMLQPCLKAGLSLPILHNPAFRRVVRLDEHWQEALLDPGGREDEQLTVIWVNKQWLVIPGYHGRPQRRLVMKPEQVLEYQRRVFAAAEKNNLAAWLEVGRWYVKWRDEVSVPVR
jgi:hypothetical protein